MCRLFSIYEVTKHIYLTNLHGIIVGNAGNEAKFRLEMASVLYVHTHRFYTELWALVSSLFGRTGTGRRENEIEPSAAQQAPADIPLVILNIQAGNSNLTVYDF